MKEKNKKILLENKRLCDSVISFSFFSFYLNSLFATLHPYPLSFAHSRFLYHSIVFSRFNSYSRDKIISFQRFCNKKADEVHVIQMTSYNSVSVLEGHASRATSSFSRSDSTAFTYDRGSPTLLSSRIGYGFRFSVYAERRSCAKSTERTKVGDTYPLPNRSISSFMKQKKLYKNFYDPFYRVFVFI